MAREQKRLARDQAVANTVGAQNQDLSNLTADLAEGSAQAISPLIPLVKLLARQLVRETAEAEHWDTDDTLPE